MIELVDIKKGLGNAALIKRRHFIIFFLATIFAITLVAILMITSGEKYVLELIFSLLISIAYLLYLVFFFSVIRVKVNNELRFYDGASKVELNKIECKLTKILEDKKENNGLEYYVLEASVIQKFNEDSKNFLITKKFNFKENQKAILYTYGSVVIKVELK